VRVSEDRFAVAVVRAWIEAGYPNTLKVRVMRAQDGGPPDGTIGVASDVDAALEILRRKMKEKKKQS